MNEAHELMKLAKSVLASKTLKDYAMKPRKFDEKDFFDDLEKKLPSFETLWGAGSGAGSVGMIIKNEKNAENGKTPLLYFSFSRAGGGSPDINISVVKGQEENGNIFKDNPGRTVDFGMNATVDEIAHWVRGKTKRLLNKVRVV